jgi:hypothetical protein
MPDIRETWSQLSPETSQVIICDLQEQIVARSKTTTPAIAVGRGVVPDSPTIKLPLTLSVVPENKNAPRGFGHFWVDAALRYEFRYSAHPLSFQYLDPLAADFISADYPYLCQITECAADLVIDPSLERRLLRR